ncbi:conserved exported hypothetical protein [Frankia canadensis]|uniref:N,N-dimethylformamidase beta subunit-like C-terminal domain-containing protein n=1 Tax=Frankia canadensis TaxID=1836972 RepID=A0A2I2KK96_9ACTN|nr:N,N-dimethylformamidase beta subunit family domain-containing protein [Frankia canadensis]SNQ46083.1 conserved exported hypothetical protein [Frankia canadensis]SOU53373.1 conserved exported hypothetical protein [Frankia canadensis]
MSRCRPLRVATCLCLLACLSLLVGCSAGGTRRAGGPGGSGSATSGPGGRRAAAAGLDVRVENGRPGAECGLSQLGAQHAVEGFADRVSIRPGEPVRLFVSTTAPSLTVSVFRTGWYGGRTCRLIATTGPLPGAAQAQPGHAPGTNTISAADWRPTASFATASWPPGDYLFRLDASTGDHRYIPLTVRGPGAAGRVVILNAVTTWQAYNAWGGYSLYHGPRGFADRARVVSFDRPYDYGDGAADFTGNEQPLVALAERLNLPVDYETDVDLHADPHLLDGARAVISLGHDEYYSPAMRTALTAARDRGTNLAFLGANAVYRRIRLDPSPLGADRLETAYKVAQEDPVYGRDDARITANWPSPPRANPESSLTGGMYQCNPVHGDMVISRPQSWLLAGTGLAAGARLPGLIGSEYDRVDDAYPTPHPIEVIAHSPITCRGAPDHSDVSYYSAPSGAGVFDSGTSAWACALADVCGPGAHGPAIQQPITRITTTLLTAFAAGPAGRTHPAVDAVPADDRAVAAPGENN